MLFVALVLAHAIDTQSAAVLTGIVAAAAAETPELDVVTAEDLRRALDQEASLRWLGCDDKASCLAEIANAMGARLVLYGTAGQLDDELVVTLQLLDSQSGSGQRGVARAVGEKELSSLLAAETRKLVSAYLTGTPPADGQRVRCLVLDLKGEAAANATVSPLPLLGLVGMGVGALGVLGVLAGGAIDAFVVSPLDAKAQAPTTPQIEAARIYGERDGASPVAIALYGIGAGVALAGALTAAAGFMMDGE